VKTRNIILQDLAHSICFRSTTHFFPSSHSLFPARSCLPLQNTVTIRTPLLFPSARNKPGLSFTYWPSHTQLPFLLVSIPISLLGILATVFFQNFHPPFEAEHLVMTYQVAPFWSVFPPPRSVSPGGLVLTCSTRGFFPPESPPVICWLW